MHFYLLTEINRQPTNLPHVEGTRDALLRMSAGEASGPPPPAPPSIQTLSFETVGQPELYSDHQSKNLNLIYSAVWAKIHIFWHPQLVAIFGDKNIDILK